MRCLVCGREMESVESYRSVVEGSDDEVYWRCGFCELSVIPEYEGLEMAVKVMGEKWKKVPRGSLCVMSWEEVL